MKVLSILLCVAFTNGFYIDNNGTHENKILGGHNITIEDLPYQASLLRSRWFGSRYLCGATIIHESWVVTAAHCVKNLTNISVRTGTGLRAGLGKRHKVDVIIIHEEYDIDTKNDDIALIKLEVPIRFNNKQKPIEIAKPHDIPREGELMLISGFGKIGENLRKSDVLKAAYVRVKNQENCKEAYRWSDPITDSMFCAGDGDTDACDGDSGGPGVIHGKLYGIISSGQYCGSTRFPGVYTRMYAYHNWIEEMTRLRF